MIIVRYDELFLKSESVRRRWEKILVANLQAGMPNAEVTSRRGRIYVDSTIGEAKPVIEMVFGVHSFSDSKECADDIDSIKQEALPLLGKGSFAVRTNRADKTYPMTSQEVSREVGAFLVEKTQQKVNLSKPESEVFIELFEGKAFLFNEKIPGPGGLPVGTGGRLMLINDSENALLAGWLIMKRGCTLDIKGAKAPELEAWSIGHKINYVEEGDYPAIVSGSTDLGNLGDGIVFHPLLGLPDAMIQGIKRKVFN